jgi:4-alpha-glucanotransferase
MILARSAGVLLHPTSLPGPDGIGTLGREARTFVDRLAEAGQRWWQILPLNPPDHGGSPYSASSAFAANTMLIELDPLCEAGWLDPSQVDAFRQKMSACSAHRCHYRDVEREKGAMLDRAFERWSSQKSAEARADFDDFVAFEADWLKDYALYTALKQRFEQKSWRDWPAEFVRREPDALAAARAEHAREIERVEFAQWIVWRQWQKLREFARERGVKFIGDIPIFVAMDSADAWAHREIFQIDSNARVREVSGVPPDYFSEFGQKWGNPLYDWEAVEAQDFRWWLGRIRTALASVDVIRIDHFRGFQDYWAVPAEAETAIDGRWRPGPKDAFFDAIRAEFGEVPFIAEDLGMITEDVHELRDRQELPGMKVLQFADFNDPQHIFLPENYPENFVAYTGTHDNDTTRGWYSQLDDSQRHPVRVYLGSGDEEIVRAMIAAVFNSRAALAIVPLQDIFELGSDARMNDPSGRHESWTWRMSPALLDAGPAWERLAARTEQSGR